MSLQKYLTKERPPAGISDVGSQRHELDFHSVTAYLTKILQYIPAHDVTVTFVYIEIHPYPREKKDCSSPA